jgi:hypothetical protein
MSPPPATLPGARPRIPRLEGDVSSAVNAEFCAKEKVAPLRVDSSASEEAGVARYPSEREAGRGGGGADFLSSVGLGDAAVEKEKGDDMRRGCTPSLPPVLT